MVLVLCAVIDVEVSEDSRTETVLREHTLDDLTEEAIRALSLEEAWAEATLTTRIARELEVNTIVPLLTSEHDLVGIDDDDVVATVYVWGEVGLVLPAKKLRDGGAHTTQALTSCVDHDPLLSDGSGVSRDGLET